MSQALQIAGRKISLRSQMALHDVFYQKNAAAEFALLHQLLSHRHRDGFGAA